MATLLKLQLCGVRSFGPFEEQTQQLKFVTPLTLILGQNGSGKTTIIESIRYACTGELPENSNKGQAFVNDPKMSQTKTIKGQVKLRFSDPLGEEVTVSRIMEVTQMNATMKFASKSMSIKVAKPGQEPVSITGRCQDVTAECCQRMNVPASVLNNVIFCHQENSTWPLDETKKVKDRFDEIFDAVKYNAASEKMKKLVKDKEARIKVLLAELEGKRGRKEAVEKDKRNLERRREHLDRLNAEIEERRREKEPIEKRIEEICNLQIELGTLERQLAAKEEAKKGLLEQQDTIRGNITEEHVGSDEDLQAQIQSSEANRVKDESHIKELDKKKFDLDDKGAKLSDVMQKVQTKIGELNQEKVQNDRKLQNQQKLLENARDLMGISLDDETSTVIATLKNKLKTAGDELKKKIEEIERHESSLQNDIDKAREKQVRTKQTIVNTEQDLKDSKKKIREISDELGTLNSSDYLLDQATTKLEELTKTLCNLKKTFNEPEEQQKINEFVKEIEVKEQTLDALERDHRILQQNDVTEGKIENEKHTIHMKEQEISKILFRHSDELAMLFGAEIPQTNIKNATIALQNKENAEVKRLSDSITKLDRDVTRLEAESRIQVEKVTNCEEDLKSKTLKINEACNGKTFDETIKTVHQSREKLQREKGQLSSFVVIYQQFLKEFEKNSPCCPVCETNFANRNESVRKIISTIRNKMQKIPSELSKVESNLRKDEDTYNKLEQLRMVNDEIEQLSTERLPQLKSQLEIIKQDLQQKNQQVEQLKQQLQGPQQKVDVARQIVTDVASIDHHRADIERCKKTVTYLQEQIVRVDSNKSKRDIEEEIETLKSDIAELRRKCEVQQKKMLKHKDKLQQLSQERSTLLANQLSLQESIQNKPLLESQKVELEEKITKSNETLKQLIDSLSTIDEELKTVQQTKTEYTKKSKSILEDERNKLKAKESLVQDIVRVQNEIDDFTRMGIDAKLEQSRSELTNYKKQEENLNRSRANVLDAISAKQNGLANHELTLRNLQDNLLLRQKEASADKLDREIVDLRKKIGGFNYRTVRDEKLNLESKSTALEKNINNLDGEKNGLIVSIAELEEDLNQPENRQAYTAYLHKYYEVEVTRNIVRDLQLYAKGFEKAVIEFHKAKMVQINRNIRELWREIYRGNDIDYIEIKTEHSNSKRSSYDYKVVQQKKGVELDMRGRCSAGQKILACLIIRMALAETLSTNCGILALDEPTTNLDRENIHSLCNCLSRIVTNRSQDRNFQLIVITHDEEFLQSLTRMQVVPYFFRVSRDDEGFSLIKKEYSNFL